MSGNAISTSPYRVGKVCIAYALPFRKQDFGESGIKRLMRIGLEIRMGSGCHGISAMILLVTRQAKHACIRTNVEDVSLPTSPSPERRISLV